MITCSTKALQCKDAGAQAAWKRRCEENPCERTRGRRIADTRDYESAETAGSAGSGGSEESAGIGGNSESMGSAESAERSKKIIFAWRWVCRILGPFRFGSGRAHHCDYLTIFKHKRNGTRDGWGAGALKNRVVKPCWNVFRGKK